jgi:hypothetical protein
MRPLLTTSMLVAALLVAVPAAADEVIFLNGDRLTGKIVSAAGGKLVIKTEAAGEVTIDLPKVKTFSTDEPVRVRVGEKTQVDTKVTAGPTGQVQAQLPGALAEPLPIAEITAINPPLPAWKGAFALNGLFTTGNSVTEQIGFTFDLSKRWPDDRLSFHAEYSFGRQEDPNTGVTSTSVDYGQAWARYQHYFTEKFYGYGLIKFERDGVAGLNYRFSPSAGPGYQWFEGPTFNLFTEAPAPPTCTRTTRTRGPMSSGLPGSRTAWTGRRGRRSSFTTPSNTCRASRTSRATTC